LDALGAEENDPTSEPSCLALRAYELSLQVDDEVVTLIHPEREQHSVAATDQLGEDHCLGPLPDIDRVVAELRRFL
jgi:hypothetical protein